MPQHAKIPTLLPSATNWGVQELPRSRSHASSCMVGLAVVLSRGLGVVVVAANLATTSFNLSKSDRNWLFSSFMSISSVTSLASLALTLDCRSCSIVLVVVVAVVAFVVVVDDSVVVVHLRSPPLLRQFLSQQYSDRELHDLSLHMTGVSGGHIHRSPCPAHE